MGYIRAEAECFKMIGVILSPPGAFEQSKEVSAVQVSSLEISIEQRELFGKEGGF